MKEKSDSQKKPSKWKYLIPVVIVFLFILAGLIYRVITWTPIDSESQKASEAIIRQVVAQQLTTYPNNRIDPNSLTDKDFAQITKLNLNYLMFFLEKQSANSIASMVMSPVKFVLSDIRTLEKFTNLQELELSYCFYPKEEIPKWMQFLEKHGVIDLKNKFFIDLEPLGNLTNLRQVALTYSAVKNIRPLAHLNNLETLDLSKTSVSDLGPLRKLTHLKSLDIRDSENISDEQITDLQKALPNLSISR